MTSAALAILLRLFCWTLAGLLLPFGSTAASAQATAVPERRVALVVGNASYERAPLVNPLNDAADLAAALRRLGFEVLERSNRNAEQMRRDLADFQDKLGPGVVGLFYFAGHGVQAGRGLNYLLPVGVDYRRERDAELYGLEAGSVLRRMEEAGTALSLVILDACRDSPLPPEGRNVNSRGLGRMEAPSGSLVAFATAPGSTADENRNARNGLYTQHLLATIETPGLRVEDVFKRVRVAVERASNRRQSPEEVSKLTADFYFRPAASAPAAVLPAPVTAAAPSGGVGFSLADLEQQQAARKQWAEWQGRMRADFERTTALSLAPELQTVAWERFLATYGQDNPFSVEDERLRSQAEQLRLAAQRDREAAEAARRQQEALRTPDGQRAGAARLRVQNTFPSREWRATALDAVGRDLAADTADRLRFDHLPAGSVVPAFQALDAVRAGTISAAWASPGVSLGKDRAFGLLEGAPFGPDAASYADWRSHPETRRVVAKLYEAHGVVGLLCGIASPHGNLWSKKPINGMADLQALRIRTVGLLSDWFRAAGASVNPLPAGEIVPALDRGLIDAAIYADPLSDQQLGLPDVARVYMVGQLIGARGIDLIVNRDIWASLGRDGQGALTRACEGNVKRMTEASGSQLRAFARDVKPNVTMRRLPDSVAKALADAWKQARTEEAQKSASFAELWATLEPFLTRGTRRLDLSPYGL